MRSQPFLPLCYSWIFSPGLESSRLCWKHGETFSEISSFSSIIVCLPVVSHWNQGKGYIFL